MNELPLWVLLALCTVLTVSAIILRLGARLPRSGDWLAAASLVGMVIALFLNQGDSLWVRGWVWPKEEVGALWVAVEISNLSLMVVGAAVLLALLVFSLRYFLAPDLRPERKIAAALISCAGVGVSWISMTPWLGLIGLAITVLGGFIALIDSWDTEQGAAHAARFIREKSLGMTIAVLGATILASSGTTFLPGKEIHGDPLGAYFLCIGLLVFFRPIPFLGGIAQASSKQVHHQVIFGFIYPTWAAFAIYAKFDFIFSALKVFPDFAWLVLASSVAAVVVGLFQKQWQHSFLAWFSAVLGLSVCALGFSGAWAGIAVLLGSSLAAAALSILFSAISEESRKKGHVKQVWIKALVFLAGAMGTGFIGSLSGAGFVGWINSGQANGVWSYVFTFGSFLVSFLLWKQVWILVGMVSPKVELHGGAVGCVGVALLASLGVFWTGRLSGGMMPETTDQVFQSILGVAFPQGREHFNDAEFVRSFLFHLEAFVFACACSYWIAGRGHDKFSAGIEKFPRLTNFFSTGLGFDRLFGFVVILLTWVGARLYSAIDQKFWQVIAPGVGNWVLQGTGAKLNQVDGVLTGALNTSMRRAVAVPSKILQLIQNGNVQWYLMFGVGSGIGILLHFLRFK